MFQQAFGFVRPVPSLERLALTSWEPALCLAASVPPRPRPVPSFEGLAASLAWVLPWPVQPFRNSARVGTILVRLVLLVASFEGSLARLALPHTASHTQPRPSSTKNPSSSHLIGSVSRFARPFTGASPAQPQTNEPPPHTPST